MVDDEALRKDKGSLLQLMMYPGDFHYFSREHVVQDAWNRVDQFFARNLRAPSAARCCAAIVNRFVGDWQRLERLERERTEGVLDFGVFFDKGGAGSGRNLSAESGPPGMVAPDP